MNKFWKWQTLDLADGKKENVLRLYGAIAEESWWDDDVTPKEFRDELDGIDGDVTVVINSPGGDCVAAAQIYNMLMEHKGNVTVKVDGIAASAASVIAMAGGTIIMSPLSMMMIHNPMTCAFGNVQELEKAKQLLDETKESIINAYELKTGLSRTKLSHLMDDETWMSAGKAQELGFCDLIMTGDTIIAPNEEEISDFAYSRVQMTNAVNDRIAKAFAMHEPEQQEQPEQQIPEQNRVSVSDIDARLENLRF